MDAQLNWVFPCALVAITLLTAAVPYVLLERRWRWRWQEIEIGQIPAHLGDAHYRQGAGVPTYLPCAPRIVKIAAFTSFVFGQLFAPLVLMATIATLFYGIGLLWTPFAIATLKQYRAGAKLLRRVPRSSYLNMRTATRWVIAVYSIFVAVTLGFAILFAGPDILWAPILIFDGFALLAIAQALLCSYAIARHKDALFASTRAFHVAAGDPLAA